MKRFFNFLLILFIVIAFSACTFGVGNNIKGSEKVSFNFRASEALTGSTLVVSVTDGDSDLEKKEQSDLVAGQTYSFNFPDMPIGKTVTFTATVIKPDLGLLYESSTSKQIQPGSNSVSLNLTPFSGYFLWSNVQRKTKVSYSISNDMTVNMDDGAILRSAVADFAFDSNGDVWVLEKEGAVTRIEHGKTALNSTRYDNPTGASGTTYSISPYDEGILVGSCTDTDVARLDYVTFTGGSVSPKLIKIKPEPTKLFNEINNITVCDRGTIYLGTNSMEKSGAAGQIFQGTLDLGTREFKLTETPVFNSATEPLLKGFVITDIQVLENNIYALFIDTETQFSNGAGACYNSRGAIVKIPINAPSNYVIKGLYNPQQPEPAPKPIIMEKSDSNLKKYFVGPRKFVAIKPKELVIADAGAIIDSDIKLKKRILSLDPETMDIGEFTFKEINNMPEELFQGSLNSSITEFVYNWK